MKKKMVKSIETKSIAELFDMYDYKSLRYLDLEGEVYEKDTPYMEDQKLSRFHRMSSYADIAYYILCRNNELFENSNSSTKKEKKISPRDFNYLYEIKKISRELLIAGSEDRELYYIRIISGGIYQDPPNKLIIVSEKTNMEGIL